MTKGTNRRPRAGVVYTVRPRIGVPSAYGANAEKCKVRGHALSKDNNASATPPLQRRLMKGEADGSLHDGEPRRAVVSH
ncbi:hypothetical protein EVAR_56789_1 [Eumeta japonica]|uniref:Uncharacterized protein n=1 Tax=Eumeta variegata TaxID=151549 RepID=A0A4C1YVY4_EUMVA|nr:hypothetical protein EVAR_56789_1 [Eumeta japonica]